MALRFYVRLPSCARDAWRTIEATDDEAIDEAAWAAGRALLNQQYDRALAAGLKGYRSPRPADASEQEILDYAVEITQRR